MMRAYVIFQASFVPSSNTVIYGRKDAFIALILLQTKVIVSLHVAGLSVDTEMISLLEDYLPRA